MNVLLGLAALLAWSAFGGGLVLCTCLLIEWLCSLFPEHPQGPGSPDKPLRSLKASEFSDRASGTIHGCGE